MPTIADAEKRLARMEEVSRRGRSAETQVLLDTIKSLEERLAEAESRLDALEG
jgi:hypothetical protein